jgi:hypothetical protein
MMKRDLAKNGGQLPQSEPMYKALETIWWLKLDYISYTRRVLSCQKLDRPYALVRMSGHS